MLPRAPLLALFLYSLPALGQADELFAKGKSPPFAEQDLDRRFRRSQLAHLLRDGTDDPNCGQVIGGLLTLLAEVAPTLHRHDESFVLDPVLLQAAQTQLENAQFSGTQYLALMVRQVMLDHRLPDAWMQTATRLNQQYHLIDLAKLKLLANGERPIDNYSFTLAELRQRYSMRIERATSASPDSWNEFKEHYIDREVAWTDFTLLDVLPAAAVRHPLSKHTAGSAGELVAELQWSPPPKNPNRLMLFGRTEKHPAIRVLAHLRTRQLLDLAKLQKGRPMTVRGRIWDINRSFTAIEIQNALLFETRDWTGALLADPRGVLACPAAINEVTGLSPDQPGGFGHRAVSE